MTFEKVEENNFLDKFKNLMGGRNAGFITGMLTPAWIVFILGILFPIAYGVFISFFWITRTEFRFIGIQNYTALLVDSKFHKYYINTLTFTVITVSIELVLGLAIALLLNKTFRGRGIVRASVLVPWAIPTIVNALIWEFIFKADMQGMVNDLLARIGVIDRDNPIVFAGGNNRIPINFIWLIALFAFPICLFIVIYTWLPKLIKRTYNFLENPPEVIAAIVAVVSGFLLFLAPPNIWDMNGLLGFATMEILSDFIIICIVDIWKTTPFMALLLLASLQTIPRDLYKAAEVDGATPWQQFRHITFPLLIPGLGTSLIFRVIDAFRVYDILAIFSARDISSITKYAVLQHSNGYYGTASAIAVVTFLNIIVFTAFFMYLTGREGEQ